ncbi:MAG: hypothetical protein ACRCX2_33255 [Paraclostridium sp.]
MIKIKRSEKIRSKSKVVPIGTNTDYGVDNIITLYRSSNDVFYGVIDYIFYRVLCCTPVEHVNSTPLPFDYTEEEIDDMNLNYEEYDSKYDKEISKVLKDDIETAIIYIRNKAIKEGVITEFTKGKYTEVKESYNLEYIIGKVLQYYREA